MSRRYISLEWALGTAILLGAIASTGIAISFIIALKSIRKTMVEMHGSVDEENVWGIGQVGAIFAWAPVLVDIAYKSKIIWS